MGKARTSAKPVRPSATLNLPVPSSMPEKEERDRKMGKWAKKVDSKKLDMAGMPGSFSLSHTGLLSLLQCPEIRERDKSRQRSENEKDGRTVASVRRVVAQKNIITEKRWARRGCLLSLFGCLPL